MNVRLLALVAILTMPLFLIAKKTLVTSIQNQSARQVRAIVSQGKPEAETAFFLKSGETATVDATLDSKNDHDYILFLGAKPVTGVKFKPTSDAPTSVHFVINTDLTISEIPNPGKSEIGD